MKEIVPNRIVISRTDAIGDVLLTLPMTAWLKENFPTIHITFLCRNYTAPLVRMYACIDEVLVWDELSEKSLSEQIKILKNFDTFIHVFPRKEIARLVKKAGVRNRIGTSHRLFHFLNCNIRPNFTRKNSNLHEAQLNFELLQALKRFELPSLDKLIAYTFNFKPTKCALPFEFSSLENYVCLHPKSQGSAREWPIEKYISLAEVLVEKGIKVVFTGTQKEGELFRNELPNDSAILDSTGKLTIDQLVILIQKSIGIVACSTGPLHIGGFLGVKAIGLFSPRKPIHPGRWKALGVNASALVFDENCSFCLTGKECNCMKNIKIEKVVNELDLFKY